MTCERPLPGLARAKLNNPRARRGIALVSLPARQLAVADGLFPQLCLGPCGAPALCHPRR